MSDETDQATPYRPPWWRLLLVGALGIILCVGALQFIAPLIGLRFVVAPRESYVVPFVGFALCCVAACAAIMHVRKQGLLKPAESGVQRDPGVVTILGAGLLAGILATAFFSQTVPMVHAMLFRSEQSLEVTVARVHQTGRCGSGFDVAGPPLFMWSASVVCITARDFGASIQPGDVVRLHGTGSDAGIFYDRIEHVGSPSIQEALGRSTLK